MIVAKKIYKTFISKDGRKVEALKDVNLSIKQGEFVSIVGPSGCGKTTLLRILAGLLKYDSGQLLINDSVQKKTNNGIGYMSQADSLLPWRNVIKNVELGLELRNVASRERKRIAQELIERTGLRGFEKNYPFELSGGMKKRVAFIRTLAYAPSIIFMDEPFGALDVQTRDMLEDDILRIWGETKKTIVFVTHDLSEAIVLADRVFLMTARPTTIKSDYKIALPRPRTTDIRLTPEFNRILRELWNDLSMEVKKSRGESDEKI
ncbi:MAG: ABC transporter ATP-binding protein [Firmicutes bacterium HGW-Firmicutes-8]|nr:MAG: ABC transporter ATP-binding protein [Firmicutes bacterium HGW-Firmicutes-8]